MKTFLLFLVLATSLWCNQEVDFFQANRDGDLLVVEALVNKEGRASIHQLDKDRNTPLHLACNAKEGGNKAELIEYLIKNGADINLKNRFHSTPLHVTVGTKNIEGTKILLNTKGINLNQKDEKTFSVLHYAVLMKSVPMLELLLTNQDIDPNIGTRDGMTPLHFAAMHGCVEEAQVLLSDSRTEPSKPLIYSDLVGATPLHFAAMQAHTDIVKLLIEKNCDVNSPVPKGNYTGYTPLHFAVMHHDPIKVFHTIKALFIAGADMKAKTAAKRTPSDFTKVKVIKQFLENPDASYTIKVKENVAK